MSKTINMIQYVSTQSKERYKHFIIHGQALSGKTKLARKMTEKLKAVYIDLLEEFASDNDLKGTIDIFGPQELKSYLRNRKLADDLIVIDNIDFLINAWDAEQQSNFLKMVAGDQSREIYCFVMQERKFIIQAVITNSQGQKRIFSIYDVE